MLADGDTLDGNEVGPLEGVSNLVAARPGTPKQELGAIRVVGGRYEAIYVVGVPKC